jgi:hypothetical protein
VPRRAFDVSRLKIKEFVDTSLNTTIDNLKIAEEKTDAAKKKGKVHLSTPPSSEPH